MDRDGVYISLFFFKQKTAYEMRISDWSSDVCSSDLMRIVLLTAGLCLAACQQAPQNASDAQTSDNMAADNMEFTEVPPDESAAVSTDALPPQIGRASCRERVC